MKDEKLPQGYKQTKVGIIPEDWTVVKIKDIANVKSGATPLRSNSNYYKNASIPWVKTTDLNNSFIINTEEKISELALKETGVNIFPKDSILIAMYGGFNQIGRTGLLKINACSNQALSVLLFTKSVHPKYILEYLNHKVYYWKRFAASSRKDPNITKSDVDIFPIILAPIKEQERIANILTIWDEAIALHVKLIKEKKQFKKGLMQKLLSGEVRFDGFNEKFEEVKLGKYIKEISKKNKENVGLVLSMSNKHGFIAQKDYFEQEVASKDTSNYKVVKKGNFAYNPSRINVGSIGLLEEYEIGILSPMYVVFECLKGLNEAYFEYWLSTHNFVGNLFKYLSGSVRDSLSFKDMKLMKIKLPSLLEQQKITEILSSADYEINLLKQELEAFKLQKKGLMQKLLTGEVRVKM